MYSLPLPESDVDLDHIGTFDLRGWIVMVSQLARNRYIYFGLLVSIYLAIALVLYVLDAPTWIHKIYQPAGLVAVCFLAERIARTRTPNPGPSPKE